MSKRKTLFLLLATAAAAVAQVALGTIAGEVRDSSRAVVPNASITLRNDATGFVRTTSSSDVGEYLLPDLSAGAYTITVEKEGFRKATAKGVVVEVNQRTVVDLNLELGPAQGDGVTVTATVSPLETGDASEGFRLGTDTMTQLPLVGRRVLSLVNIGAGVIPRQLSGYTHDLMNDVQAARGDVELNSPVNGARATMNNYIVDGANNTDPNTFAIVVLPPLESVEEFRTQSSLGSAEYPQAGGGVTDLVTKSGGREFHGNVFEFLRNEATDARGYFDAPDLQRAIFRQNQFGASLSGRLPWQSTYFYGAYEGLRGQSAKATLHLLPPADVRGGDFSQGAPIFDPASYDPATGERQLFPGNIIPSKRIDPIATNYLQNFEPLPNLPPGGPSNYLDATPNQEDHDSGSLRIDHQFDGAGTLFARYTINDDRSLLAGNFPERTTVEGLRAQQVALGHTFARGSWTNEARASFTRLRVLDLPETGGLPYYVINDFETVTDNTRIPQTQRDNTWAYSDGLTMTRARHTWKAGLQFAHSQVNYLQSSYANGEYIFTGFFTADPLNPSGTGDAFADFLLGDAQTTHRTVGSAQAYLRQNNFGAFVQDEWRLRPGLALNLGLRYDYLGPYTEARGRMLNLDWSHLPQPPQLIPVSQAWNPDLINFSPRVGLVWRLPKLFGSDRETVFRAGYGIYYAPPIAASAYDLVRNNVLIQNNETTDPLPVLTLANGFPQNAQAGFPSYYGIDPNARTPYVQQWNGGFQRSLAGGMVLDVAYVASKGTKLERFRTFNTPAHVETGQDLGPRPGDLQSLRTFPELGPIIQRQHIANSSYQSLQIKVDKRFSSRLMFLASFVWSKSIDDADSPIPGLLESFGAQDERNLRLERGLSFFNVGRRLSSGFV